jgi:hypothetical protein
MASSTVLGQTDWSSADCTSGPNLLVAVISAAASPLLELHAGSSVQARSAARKLMARTFARIVLADSDERGIVERRWIGRDPPLEQVRSCEGE